MLLSAAVSRCVAPPPKCLKALTTGFATSSWNFPISKPPVVGMTRRNTPKRGAFGLHRLRMRPSCCSKPPETSGMFEPGLFPASVLPPSVIHPDRALSLDASVVTIGAFDGVHRGHQALIEVFVRQARELGVPAVVCTFDPPPRVAFGAAEKLIDTRERIRRLRFLGADHIVLAHFTTEYRQRSPLEFIEELAALSPVALWVGDDFRFGRDRAGDTALLARHFDLQLLPKVVCSGGERVSSSRIRALFAQGRNAEADTLLGWQQPWGTERMNVEVRT
nr:riboflavin kinase/FMN adenylyltransferase [uncultured bacterium]